MTFGLALDWESTSASGACKLSLLFAALITGINQSLPINRTGFLIFANSLSGFLLVCFSNFTF